MNKKVKWGIIIFIGAGLIGWGIYSQLPKENKELAAADKVMSSNRNGKKALNVNAKIIKPQLLKMKSKSAVACCLMRKWIFLSKPQVKS